MNPADFTRCVCLTLARRPDRWDTFCTRRAAVQDWPFPEVEPVLGVDGFSEGKPDWWRERPGAWGCLASYVRLLQEAREGGLESLLCFEDDALFKPDLGTRARAYLAAVPDDWDVLYLGCLHWNVYRTPPKLVNREVIRPAYASGTHAWAVHRRGMQAVLDWITTPTNPGDVGLQQVDQRLAQLQGTGRLNFYAPLRNFVGQAENVSDVSGLVVGPCYWELLSDVTEPLLRSAAWR